MSEFLPPQSADDAAVPLPAAELELVPELLSLPHAVSVSAAIAVTDSVVPSVLPMLLSFTYPTFSLTAFELSGNVCGRSGRSADGE